MIEPAFYTVGLGEATVLFWVVGGALTCGLVWWAVVLVGMSGTVPWRTVGALLPILVAVMIGSDLLGPIGGLTGQEAGLAGLKESVERRAEARDTEAPPPSPIPREKETTQREVKRCALMGKPLRWGQPLRWERSLGPNGHGPSMSTSLQARVIAGRRPKRIRNLLVQERSTTPC